jgi:hypothetical protein
MIDEQALTQQTATALIAFTQTLPSPPDPAAITHIQDVLVGYSAQLMGLPLDDLSQIIAGSRINF